MVGQGTLSVASIRLTKPKASRIGQIEEKVEVIPDG